MKRELKFRALVNNKTTYSNGFIKHLDGTVVVITKENNETVETSPIDNGTLCQFTGLKDKNGKEIYEGDIVEYTQHRAYNLGGFKAKVVYDNERACFGYIKEKPFISNFINSFTETDELKYDLLNYLEVIGNIHENSDLLS